MTVQHRDVHSTAVGFTLVNPKPPAKTEPEKTCHFCGDKITTVTYFAVTDEASGAELPQCDICWERAAKQLSFLYRCRWPGSLYFYAYYFRVQDILRRRKKNRLRRKTA